jgi:hypothetical protein
MDITKFQVSHEEGFQPLMMRVTSIEGHQLQSILITPNCSFSYKSRVVQANDCIQYGWLFLAGTCRGLKGQYGMN